MSITLAAGTTVAIASTYGTQFTVTAITNASSMVATLSASHGVTANDIFEITSGWPRLNTRILKAASVSTNDVTCAVNTTSTTFYTAGSGTGTGREITAWTTITQLTKDISSSGGDPQFANTTTLDSPIETQIPTRLTPIAISLPCYYDNSLSWVSTVQTAAETQALTAVRFSFPNGTILYGNGYWAYRYVPNIADETLRGEVTVTLTSLPTTV